MIYENMSKEEMIKLLEQRNNLLREQHSIIKDQKNKLSRMIVLINSVYTKLPNNYNLNKRSSTIFWDVV